LQKVSAERHNRPT